MYYGTHYDAPVGDIFLACEEEHLIGLWIGEQKYITKTMPKGIVEIELAKREQSGAMCSKGQAFGMSGQDETTDEEKACRILEQAVGWLEDYFAGKQPQIKELPLAPSGGTFRQMVWEILMEIPYGGLTTYGEIAKKVAERMGRNRMSAQAVGGAVGHNPISIIIPCHRVVGANGSLTGYAGGIEKKIMLLTHEGVDMTKLFVPKK